MNILIRAIVFIISFSLISCAYQQQVIAADGKQSFVVSLPSGWIFYDANRMRGSRLPMTIVPEKKLSQKELTTTITFYTSRDHVGYFPKKSVRLSEFYCKGRLIKLWLAENIQAKYVLADFNSGGHVLFASLVVAATTDQIFEARKVEFLNIVCALDKF